MNQNISEGCFYICTQFGESHVFRQRSKKTTQEEGKDSKNKKKKKEEVSPGVGPHSTDEI